MSEEEVSEWQRLPAPLQHQFYDHARREAERRIEILRKLNRKLERVRGLLRLRPVGEAEWGELRIGVVDGSSPPSPDVRLCGSYALFCSSYKIFEGEELVDEGYRSGMLFRGIADSDVSSRMILRLLMARLERKSALECLKRGVDWLIVDGSFFGFRYRCRRMEDVEISWYEADEGGEVMELGLRGEELIGEVFRDTERLIRAKTIAIVKRVRTAALDGLLIERSWDSIEAAENPVEMVDEIRTGLPDKTILSILMPPRSYFLYRDLLPHPGGFYYYTNMAGQCKAWIKERLRRGESIELGGFKAFSEERVEHRERRENFPKGLFERIYPEMIKLERGYFKAYESAPSCCFEINPDSPLEEILPYLVEFNNEDTGHPFPLDLVDNDVGLPIWFTREFVEEVEAQIVREAGAEFAERYFQYLNPQKKWGYR
jgi:hypothetical protein